MTDHDPLCHAANFEYHDPECCDCILIAKVRADERERQEDGWAARLDSTVAWAENGVRADLRAKVKTLHAKAEVVGLSERAFAYEVVLKLINGSSDD